MNISESKYNEILAYESFIRRAAQLNFPFLLKGSYITRQYFPNIEDRIPADLDWLFLGTASDVTIAQEKFDKWIDLIRKINLSDNTIYNNDKLFWYFVNYPLIDDFPTVSTEIDCSVNEKYVSMNIDISFNLEITHNPVPLLYKPLVGEPFYVPNTPPLSLQVAWKIHQTLIRPRFKDLFDLIYLVQHPDFNNTELENMWIALVHECNISKTNVSLLNDFLSFNISKLFLPHSIEATWYFWRNNKVNSNVDGLISFEEMPETITDMSKLPTQLSDFLELFTKTLITAGIDTTFLKKLN
jgi:hypothetical protein